MIPKTAIPLLLVASAIRVLADLPAPPDTAAFEERMRAELEGRTAKAKTEFAQGGPNSRYSVQAREIEQLDCVLASLTGLRVSLENGTAAQVEVSLKTILDALKRLGGTSGLGELQEESAKVRILLETYSGQLVDLRLSTWREEVDALFTKVREFITTRRDVADVEALMVEVSALRRPNIGSSDALNQRYQRKLAGLNATLSAWVSYLDYKAAGAVKQANAQLTRLLDTKEFPVLDHSWIVAAILTDPLTYERSTDAMKDIEKLSDIPAGLETIRSLLSHPPNSHSRNYLEEADHQLTRLQEAATEVKAENYQFVLETLNAEPSRYLSASAGSLDRLLAELEREYLAGQDLIRDEIPLRKGESGRAYFMRISSTHLKAREYAQAEEAARLADELPRGTHRLPFQTENSVRALHSLLTAQRFESSGDQLMALSHYRSCVATVGSAELLVKDAEEGIRRIARENPELLSQGSAEVIGRLDAIEQELRHIRVGRIRR